MPQHSFLQSWSTSAFQLKFESIINYNVKLLGWGFASKQSNDTVWLNLLKLEPNIPAKPAAHWHLLQPYSDQLNSVNKITFKSDLYFWAKENMIYVIIWPGLELAGYIRHRVTFSFKHRRYQKYFRRLKFKTPIMYLKSS